MATTTHIGITLVEQSQAQKEVTVNQALTRIDALLNTGAKSRSVSTPPGSPASGDLYIVGSSPTGAWTGEAGVLAYYDQVWRFIPPNEGMTLWVDDEDLIYSYNGSSWVASIFGETNTASNLGSGTGIYSTKVGVDLRFKSLIAGSGIALSNTSNDITISTSLGSVLTALSSYNSNGLVTQTAANTFTGRAITAPAAGITVTNGNGISGNPTLGLANDLSALEGLNSVGFATRTGVDTWTTRSLTAGTGIVISDNFGTAANPSISLSAHVSDLSDASISTPADGDMLVYSSSAWHNTPLPESRNLLINGDMRIDQANEGSSVTLASGTAAYIADGWKAAYTNSTAVVTAQQVADAPAGFIDSLKITVSTGATVAAGDSLVIQQPLEGFIAQPLGYGAAGASAVSLSFWVKSSQTGTFSYALRNSANNRTYVGTFTIISANTWEKKSLTNITGDTSGTWLSTNGIGLLLTIVAACGSTNQTSTLGSWQAAGTLAASTQTNSNLSTNSATFQLTGAQLEAGAVCTPYARRRYDHELQLCKRYYCKTFSPGTKPAQNAGAIDAWSIVSDAASTYGGAWLYPVEMRAAPTVTSYNPSTTNANWRDTTNSADRTVTISTAGYRSVPITGASGAAGAVNRLHLTADARL